MSIYQFQNILYSIYDLKSILIKDKLYIEHRDSNGNLFNRAIGEEITDFLKQSKINYIIYPIEMR